MSGMRPNHFKLPAVQISPEELAGVNLTEDDVQRLRGLQARMSGGNVRVEEFSGAVIEDLHASTSSSRPAVTQPLPAVALTEADYLGLQHFQQRITAQGIPTTRVSSTSRSSPFPRSIQAPANEIPTRQFPARPSVSSMSYPIRNFSSAATLPGAYASTASSAATGTATAHAPAVYLNTLGSRVPAPSALCTFPFPRASEPNPADIPVIKSAGTSKKSRSIPTPQSRQQIQFHAQGEPEQARSA